MYRIYPKDYYRTRQCVEVTVGAGATVTFLSADVGYLFKTPEGAELLCDTYPDLVKALQEEHHD